MPRLDLISRSRERKRKFRKYRDFRVRAALMDSSVRGVGGERNLIIDSIRVGKM